MRLSVARLTLQFQAHPLQWEICMLALWVASHLGK